MELYKIALIFILIVFSYCNSNETVNVKKQVVCDSVDTTKFLSLIKNNWPLRKPNSIQDAVRLLDSMADENFHCAIITFKDVDLYFNLGLNIRNDWVRLGTDSIRNQFYNKLKLINIDYTSGLIIDIYRQLLINKNVNLVDKYLLDKNQDSSFETREKEFKIIQRELFIR